MSRTPAKVTQADVARAIRAAQQCGAGAVKVLPDGTIMIEPQPIKRVKSEEKEVEQRRSIAL